MKSVTFFKLAVVFQAIALLCFLLGYFSQAKADENAQHHYWVGELSTNRVRASKFYCKLWPSHVSFFLFPHGEWQPLMAVVFDVNKKLVAKSAIQYTKRGVGWHRFTFAERIDTGDECWVGIASGPSHRPIGIKILKTGNRTIGARFEDFDEITELNNIEDVIFGELDYKLD